MLDTVEKWVMMPNDKKPMLTLSGPPEVGKTHLLKEVKRLFQTYECEFKHRKFNYPTVFYIRWSELTGKGIEDTNLVDKIANSGIVIIEDFYSEEFFKRENKYEMWPLNNFTRIVIDFAFRVINLRVGKATLIDTNRDITQIEIIDKRVASRLFREDGQHLDIPENTTMFHSRK